MNALSCSNLGVCSNTGWCSLGGNAGAPCMVGGLAGECPGGTCTNLPTASRPHCTADVGTVDLGGCGRHQVCITGNVGRLCINASTVNAVDAANCGAGGLCQAYSATASTAGPLCYKIDSFLPQQPISQGCLPPGSSKRLIGRALPGSACP